MASMVDVMKFFELRPGEFKRLWAALTKQDQLELKAGIGDGTYNYTRLP